MFHEIETDYFVDYIHPKSTILLESIEEEEGEEGGPERISEGTDDLDAELLAHTSIKQSLILIKNSSCQYGPNTTESMHLTYIKRIIDFETLY